jgi:low temperature requirement protein LtrA
MGSRSFVSPGDQSVNFVELFFDLVFVFAITQVVGILHDGITGARVLEAALVFWIIWWGWTQFTWSLNAADTDHGHVQITTLFATAIAFFMAVAVPDAFGDGALWFAGPYVAVRVLGLVIYAGVARSAEHLSVIRTFALTSIGGFAAVVIGAVLGGREQLIFWGFAILLDVIAAGSARADHWGLHPGHFVERHGLIVIIVLGESLIVAAGGLVGAPREPIVLVTGMLAVALTCALWWSYFPYVRPKLEEALEAADGARRSTIARDVFSLGHYPMLLGVIAMSAAVEEAIAHLHDPLPLEGRLALAVGLILFVGGTAVATWRALGHLPVPRIVAVLATAVAIVWLGGLLPWGTLLIAVVGLAAVVSLEHRAIRRKQAAIAA